MFTQLNPTIPLTTPKGNGQALAVIDYGSEHNLIWVIAIDDTGEIWSYQNPEVKIQKNITMKREFAKKDVIEKFKNLTLLELAQLDLDDLCKHLLKSQSTKITESNIKDNNMRKIPSNKT